MTTEAERDSNRRRQREKRERDRLSATQVKAVVDYDLGEALIRAGMVHPWRDGDGEAMAVGLLNAARRWLQHLGALPREK